MYYCIRESNNLNDAFKSIYMRKMLQCVTSVGDNSLSYPTCYLLLSDISLCHCPPLTKINLLFTFSFETRNIEGQTLVESLLVA